MNFCCINVQSGSVKVSWVTLDIHFSRALAKIIHPVWKIQLSPHVRESGFRNPENDCLWNPESWALESRTELKDSGMPLMIGIRNPCSTDQES